MKIKVKSLTLLIDCPGTDELYFNTEKLPSPVWPYEGNAVLRLDLASGIGIEYCAREFPDLPVRIISMTRGIIQEIEEEE